MSFEAAWRDGTRPAHLHRVRNSRLLWSGCPQTYHPTRKPGCVPRAHSRARTGRGWGVSAAAPPRHQLVPPGAAHTSVWRVTIGEGMTQGFQTGSMQ